MSKVTVSIGSNTGDRFTRVSNCIDWLVCQFGEVIHSNIYATKAIGGKDGTYANAVAVFHSSYSFQRLNEMLKDYELNNGRSPENRALGIVSIDIDIVMWDNEIMREKDFSQSYFSIGWNEINKEKK